jgi:hypothetical protein
MKTAHPVKANLIRELRHTRYYGLSCWGRHSQGFTDLNQRSRWVLREYLILYSERGNLLLGKPLVPRGIVSLKSDQFLLDQLEIVFRLSRRSISVPSGAICQRPLCCALISETA